MTTNTVLTDEEVDRLIGHPFNLLKRVHRIFYEDEWDETVIDEEAIKRLVKATEQALLAKVLAQQAAPTKRHANDDGWISCTDRVPENGTRVEIRGVASRQGGKRTTLWNVIPTNVTHWRSISQVGTQQAAPQDAVDAARYRAIRQASASESKRFVDDLEAYHSQYGKHAFKPTEEEFDAAVDYAIEVARSRVEGGQE